MPDRRWAIRFALLFGVVYFASIGSRAAPIPASGAFSSITPGRLQGTVTWIDRQRNLMVIDTGTNGVAIKTENLDANLSIGDDVELEGRLRRFIPALPSFPENPSRREVLGESESPTNAVDYSLSRLSGFLHPRVSGDYSFWIASDDSSELWLGDSSGSHNLRKIAQVDIARFTEPRQWTRYPSQHSQQLHLEAGKAYFIQALSQNTSGRACLAIAWDGPGFERTIIGGEFLSPEPDAGEIARRDGALWEFWTNFYTIDLSSLTNAYQYSLASRDSRIVRRNSGHLPPPIQIPERKGIDSRLIFRRIELEGRVTFVSTNERGCSIELRHGPSHVVVHLAPRSFFKTVVPTGSHLRVRGVFEPVRDLDSALSGNLWTSEEDNVIWLDNDENWSLVDPLPQIELTASNPTLSVGRIVRAQGRVVGKDDKGQWRLEGNDTLQGYASFDATNWTIIGTPVEIAMPDNVLAGFAINSHQTDSVAAVEFDNVSDLPSQLQGMDIGYPPIPGGTAFNDGTFLVRGSGFDIWGGADQCYFAGVPKSGNFELTAHLEALKSADGRAKAVLMVRESGQSNAPWAGVVMMPGNKIGFQSRLEFNGGSAGGLDSSKATWIKMVRRRNSFLVQTQSDSVAPGQMLDVLGRVRWQGRMLVLEDSHTRPVPQMDVTINPSTQSRLAGDLRDVELSELTFEAKKAQRTAAPVTVRVRGVITFNGRVGGELLSFVQGKTGVARIQWRNAALQNAGRSSEWVELTGVPALSGSDPLIAASGIVSLGPAEMPEPVSLSGIEIKPGLNGHWAEIEGVARSVSDDTGLLVLTRTGTFRVLTGESEHFPFADLVNAVVRVRGVFLQGSSPALAVPSNDCIQIVERSPGDPFEIPSFPIRLLPGIVTQSGMDRRLKVAGVVTCQRNDFVIIQDQTGGIQLQTASPPRIGVGTFAEAVGFPSQGKYGLTLVEALIRPGGSTNVPEPMIISSNALAGPQSNCGLISLEATVLEQHSAGIVQTLDLQAGQRAFRASLPKADGELPRIGPGSRIRLSGVAVIEGGDVRPLDAFRGDRFPIGSLELLLRSPRDVIVIERPPWWNWKYTLALCALISIVFGLGILWIRTLRKRVEERTQELRRTMARLEKETRTSATLAERDRLAGEIHDSVEQGLSAIVMQMEAAARLTDKPEEMSRYLLMAKNMASFSRTEVQHAVWDLQSPLLEHSDLPMALRRVAHEISAGDAAVVNVEVLGKVHALPSAVEHHLLRIAQEGITNAVKHGNARTISLHLEYSAGGVSLVVRDDGAGFIPEEVSAERGHFGLQGMRTRAVKIGAALSVTSKPGAGTCIQIVVPCKIGAQT